MRLRIHRSDTALNSLKSNPPSGNPMPSDTALIIASELIRELSTSAFGRRDTQWALSDAIAGARLLAAEEGSTIRVRAEGKDEDAALSALAELVNGKFGGEP